MPDVRLMDGEALVLGVEYPVALKKNTADPDAHVPMIDLPVGGAVSVPVVAVGVRLDNHNLGMFDGFTQPMVALVDADHDSYVGFHFSADDTPVIRMRAGGSGTVRNHTIPDVASDTIVLLAATQTLTNKTLTAPTIADFTNAGHDHGDADDGGALASGIALISPALTTPTITTSVVLTRTALGVTTNIGYHTQNTTAAAAGAQQVSPAVRWTGQGWKTDAAAASQAVEFQAYVVPVEGAANPSGYLTWEYAVNGGAYAEKLRLASDGTLTVQGFRAPDDVLVTLGTDGDQVELNHAAGLAANTALANVLLGTTAGSRQAFAANSRIVSNVTASGDYGIYVNVAGVSKEAMLVDTSAKSIHLGFGLQGIVTIGAVATNTKMTTGLTISQGEGDNEILALQSTDVTHGSTDADTNTYANFGKVSGPGGGLWLKTFNDATLATFWALGRTTAGLNAVKSTAALGSINLYVRLTSAGSDVAVTADGNIFSVQAYVGATPADTTLFLIDEDGDAYHFGSTAGETVNLIVQHTDATSATSHASVDVIVAHTSADPSITLQTAARTSYIGVDNSVTDDPLLIGDGIVVGTNEMFRVATTTSGTGLTGLSRVIINNSAVGITLDNAAGNLVTALRLAAFTTTLSNTTTPKTTQWPMFEVQSQTITFNAAGVVDVASGIIVSPFIAGANATITNNSSIRIKTATQTGTSTNIHGIYIEDQTGGASDYGLTIEGADTACIWVSSAIDTTDAANGIAFGLSRDTNLYRSAANTLKTDDALTVGGALTVSVTGTFGTAGTGTGQVQFNGTTSGVVTLTVVAAAGTWTMTLPTGVAGVGGYQLTDAAGDGVTSWTAAGSRREWKMDIADFADYRGALQQILASPLHTFRYREGYGTGDYDTRYLGVMADESPWATHFGGSIVNPVNTVGYMVAGFRAVHEVQESQEAKIIRLEARVAELEARLA